MQNDLRTTNDIEVHTNQTYDMAVLVVTGIRGAELDIAKDLSLVLKVSSQQHSLGCPPIVLRVKNNYVLLSDAIAEETLRETGQIVASRMETSSEDAAVAVALGKGKAFYRALTNVQLWNQYNSFRTVRPACMIAAMMDMVQEGDGHYTEFDNLRCSN